MEKCVASLLPGGEEVEILIIDDGSTDETAEIADRLEREHPTVIRAIHKPNGGHGSAVNTGIANARGIYFKVVDSDDCVREDAYQEILQKLHELTGGSRTLDMLISNFVYDKAAEKHHKVMHYRHILPRNEFFTWSDIHHFYKGHYILMHSVIFRTKLLRECGIRLPEHTFYVDNIFAFNPLPYVQNMYYLDTNFYRYFIGRDDQSVNETVMIRRIDQQLRVNKLMVNSYTSCGSMNKRTRAYMISYLDIITTISSIMLIRSGTKEALDKKKELLEYIRSTNRALYGKLRHSLMGNFMNLPGRGGRKVSVAAYKLCQKFYGFN